MLVTVFRLPDLRAGQPPSAAYSLVQAKFLIEPQKGETGYIDVPLLTQQIKVSFQTPSH